MRKVATALLVGALSVPSLASAGQAKHHAKDSNTSHGIASVYAHSLVGHRTANGERLDMDHMTAASLKLPIGTVVTVTNRRNGRQATVRVNDRGPYTKRFLIDLSPAAAAALGLGRTGTTPVEIKIASR
ncbi:MAG TPA: septal ring lytic transglycosylase RlpA family protein [Stellaceae bacterium]|nr:septal ring lytic transglycosylase RlpA family protein [Stellaceae bacterium]